MPKRNTSCSTSTSYKIPAVRGTGTSSEMSISTECSLWLVRESMVIDHGEVALPRPESAGLLPDARFT